MTAPLPPPDDRRGHGGSYHNEAVERRMPPSMVAAGEAFTTRAGAAIAAAKEVPGVRVLALTATDFHEPRQVLYHVTVAVITPSGEPGVATHYDPNMLLALAMQAVEQLYRASAG